MCMWAAAAGRGDKGKGRDVQQSKAHYCPRLFSRFGKVAGKGARGGSKNSRRERKAGEINHKRKRNEAGKKSKNRTQG